MYDCNDSDFDWYEAEELKSIDKFNRWKTWQGIHHPDPRDPDHIDFEEDEDVD